MAYDEHKNLALSTVTVAPSPATSGTSLTLESVALMPAAPFNATVWPPGVSPTHANAEIVRVTLVVGSVLTIARKQEGTEAQPIAANWQFANTATVLTFTQLQEAVTAAQAAAEAVTATEKARALAAEALLAPLASPSLTGTPSVPTAVAKDNTTKAASTAFVQTAKTEVEAATIASGAAAGGSLTGTYPNPTVASIPSAATATTQAAKDNTTKVATDAFVQTAKGEAETGALASVAASYAPLASPTFTGTPKAPTQAAKDNTTQVATDQFVQTAKAEAEALAVPLTQKGAASGVAELDAGSKLPEGQLPASVVNAHGAGASLVPVSDGANGYAWASAGSTSAAGSKATTASYGRTSTIAAPTLRDIVSILDFATSKNGETLVVTDGAITSASKVLTCATSKPFVAGDVGKFICVAGAGTTGKVLVTTIKTFTSSEKVEVTAAASTTVASAGTVEFGWDDTAIFQSALTALNAKGAGTLLVTPLNANGELAHWVVNNLRLNETSKGVAKDITIMAYGAHFKPKMGEGKPLWHTPVGEEANLYQILSFRFFGGVFEGIGIEEVQQHGFRLDQCKDVTFRDLYATNWASATGSSSVLYIADTRRLALQNVTCLECSSSVAGPKLNALQCSWVNTIGTTNTPITEVIITNCFVTSGQCPVNLNIGKEDSYINTTPLRVIVANNYLESYGAESWAGLTIEIGGAPPARSQLEQIAVTNNVVICKGESTAQISVGVGVLNSSQTKIYEPELFQEVMIANNIIESGLTGVYTQSCRGKVSDNIITAVRTGVFAQETGTSSYTYPITHLQITGNVLKMKVNTYATEAVAIQAFGLKDSEILDNDVHWENGEAKTVAAEACMVSGAKILRTVTVRPFVTGDIGKTIAVSGAGAAGATLTTKIVAVFAAGEIELETAASTTVGKTITDATITTGTKGLKSAAGLFEAGDAGKAVVVYQAGKEKQPLTTTIASFTEAKEVQLTANAETTAANVTAVWATGATNVTYELVQTALSKGMLLKGCERVKVRGSFSYAPSVGAQIEGCGEIRFLPGTMFLNANCKPGSTGETIKIAGTWTGNIYLEGVTVKDDKGTSNMTYGLAAGGTPSGFKCFSKNCTYLGFKTGAIKPSEAIISTSDVTTATPPQDRYGSFTTEASCQTGEQQFNVGDRSWNTGESATKARTVMWVCYEAGIGAASKWAKVKGE